MGSSSRTAPKMCSDVPVRQSGIPVTDRKRDGPTPTLGLSSQAWMKRWSVAFGNSLVFVHYASRRLRV